MKYTYDTHSTKAGTAQTNVMAGGDAATATATAADGAQHRGNAFLDPAPRRDRQAETQGSSSTAVPAAVAPVTRSDTTLRGRDHSPQRVGGGRTYRARHTFAASRPDTGPAGHAESGSSIARVLCAISAPEFRENKALFLLCCRYGREEGTGPFGGTEGTGPPQFSTFTIMPIDVAWKEAI